MATCLLRAQERASVHDARAVLGRTDEVALQRGGLLEDHCVPPMCVRNASFFISSSITSFTEPVGAVLTVASVVERAASPTGTTSRWSAKLASFLA